MWRETRYFFSDMPWGWFARRLPVCSLLFLLCLAGTLLVSLQPLQPLWHMWTFPVIADPVSGITVNYWQFWRLLSPAFLHFGAAHFLFNFLGLWVLGAAIEYCRGSVRFGLLVIVSGVCGNFLQFWTTQAVNFGGFSGVVYGMVGYLILLRVLRVKPEIPVHVPLLYLLLVWLLIGYSGLPELLFDMRIANAAHLGGLLGGMSVACLDMVLRRR